MAADASATRTAVLVGGASLAAVRRFIADNVRRSLGLKKTQWRGFYRVTYPLAVLSRPLRPGESPQDVYGPHRALQVLVLPAPAQEGLRSELVAWLKAGGFSVAELDLPDKSRESERIELGVQVVRCVNGRCPWVGDAAEN